MSDQAGFDRESAARALTQSMHILERCIGETERFLDHYFRDEKEKIGENWEEIRETVSQCKAVLTQEPKSLFRDKYYLMTKLKTLVERQGALLSGNPMEMIKMANQLASLNAKTIGMQVSIDKIYGEATRGQDRDILEELAADQIAQVYQWVEENRRMARMMSDEC